MNQVKLGRYVVGMLLFGLAFVFIVVGLSSDGSQSPGAWIALVAFAYVIVLYFLTDRDMRIESETNTVFWEWRLFGRIPVWGCRRPFSTYTAVEVWRRSSSEEPDDVRVYLLSKAGKLIQIHSFFVEPGKPFILAERAGQEVAETMGLEYHSYRG